MQFLDDRPRRVTASVIDKKDPALIRNLARPDQMIAFVIQPLGRLGKHGFLVIAWNHKIQY